MWHGLVLWQPERPLTIQKHADLVAALFRNTVLASGLLNARGGGAFFSETMMRLSRAAKLNKGHAEGGVSLHI
jgi:hypothetical protein